MGLLMRILQRRVRACVRAPRIRLSRRPQSPQRIQTGSGLALVVGLARLVLMEVLLAEQRGRHGYPKQLRAVALLSQLLILWVHQLQCVHASSAAHLWCPLH